MPLYRLKPGASHYMRGHSPDKPGLIKYEGGQLIELTEKQARNIAFKLEQVSLTEEEQRIEDVREKKVEESKLALLDLGGDEYNVIHPETQEKINDEPLSYEDAMALIEG